MYIVRIDFSKHPVIYGADGFKLHIVEFENVCSPGLENGVLVQVTEMLEMAVSAPACEKAVWANPETNRKNNLAFTPLIPHQFVYKVFSYSKITDNPRYFLIQIKEEITKFKQ